MSLGTPTNITTNVNYDDKLVSFFGRLNYNYKDLYLFTASLRADGSSKFGKDNKWGWFPAFSAAWRAGEEKFIKNLSIFSDLKLRVGYGLAGNNRIGSYNSLAILSSVFTAVGNGLGTGYASKQIPNEKLKWEANKTFNVGIDLGFFNQRLTILPEFYINKSSNLLLNANLPMSSGYSSMIINAGRTKNTGIDLTINSVNIDKPHFSWNTAITLSHNKSKVEALTGEDAQYYEARFGFNQNTHRVAVGEPLGQFYGYVSDGIYTADDFTGYDEKTNTYTLKDGVAYHGNKVQTKPGMWKFKDLDNNGVIDEKDKTVIGNANPDIYGGINNTFNIYNFDLSIYFTYSTGADVLNATKLIASKIGTTNRNALDVMNSSHRWMTIDSEGNIVHDLATLAQINQGKDVAAYYDCVEGNNYIQSWGVEDASYLKLSNITLGYTFPHRLTRSLGISRLRIYATGNNLFTITGYSGYDPEVSTMSSPLTPGVDFGAYPRSRSFIFGMNVTFYNKQTMKKHIIFGLTILAGLGMMTACSDTLTEKPDSYYEKDTYFTSSSKAEMAVLGIYSSISDLNHYGSCEMATPSSDDMYYVNGTTADNTRRDISHYQVTSSNTWLQNIWKLDYQGIYTLAGQQVSPGNVEKGKVYIINGKKVLM